MNNTTALPVNNPAWFKHWFDSSFYHKLYSNRDEKEAVGFIDELLKELQPVKHSFMLDLGCGAGRHSKYLASKGFHVTGIDLAASSIRMAKKYESAGLRFFRRDMRAPFGNAQFEYVFNFFTSFGYFKHPEENNRVVQNISRALKPGGLLLMDYINAPYSEQRLIPAEKKVIDGVIYHLRRWSDEKNIYKRILIEQEPSVKPLEYIESVAKFSLGDFGSLFDRNGLQIQKVYGDYSLNAYDRNTSPRLIMLAKKIKK